MLLIYSQPEECLCKSIKWQVWESEPAALPEIDTIAAAKPYYDTTVSSQHCGISYYVVFHQASAFIAALYINMVVYVLNEGPIPYFTTVSSPVWDLLL